MCCSRIGFVGPIVELIGADERQGVRVIFNDGTAFEAKAPAGGSAMALMILASSSLKDQTRGLLGRWNDDPSDDLTAPNGIILPRDPLTQLHDFFGLKCKEETNKKFTLIHGILHRG